MMIFIPILNPKIELSAFSRSAEPVMPRKIDMDIEKEETAIAQRRSQGLGPWAPSCMQVPDYYCYS